ncbi:hypothetical protein CICLE_v10008442mg [Citrus x clementina]|uniref:coumarin 8-geranyltransferase n=1 Tax=Citrus clementina TaxID=85681 RepID=V4U157_CITCL|nr:hypothetical protein CICLE_v10008442mg [Citrus x clementina]
MESLLVGFSPSSALVSSGSSCWRNKDLMAGHFPSFYKGLQVSRCKVWNIIDRTTVVKLERYHLKHHIRGAKDRSIYHQKIKIKHLANAASGHPLQSNQPDDYKPKSPLNSVINALDAFYRFSRPHTVIGTALSIVSVALLAVEKVSDISPLFFTGVLEAIAAALMMNIYIVGLNQLSDIEIDKVNKPYLPLASGEYSFKTGVLIVASFSIMSFWLGWIVGSWPLFWALFTSFVLGTAYSINLPLLRWKRFAVAAAMCILAVRAVVVQLAFYLHMQTHVYRRPAVFSKPLIFATAFMSFFSVVIALFKVCDVLIWENVGQINLNIVVIFLFLEIVQKDNFYNFFDPAFFFFGSKWILYRMYLILKETKHLGSELLLYVWVKSGCSGLVFLYWK